MSGSDAAPFAARPPATALADGVYRQLEREIVDGHLAPGSGLREAEVAERLGVCRALPCERRCDGWPKSTWSASRSTAATASPRSTSTCSRRAPSSSARSSASPDAWRSRTRATSTSSGSPTPSGACSARRPRRSPSRTRCSGSAWSTCSSTGDNSVLVSSAARLRLHVRRAFRLFGPQLPRLLFAERLGCIVAAARARDPELLESTLRVHTTQVFVDVIELARSAPPVGAVEP